MLESWSKAINRCRNYNSSALFISGMSKNRNKIISLHRFNNPIFLNFTRSSRQVRRENKHKSKQISIIGCVFSNFYYEYSWILILYMSLLRISSLWSTDKSLTFHNIRSINLDHNHINRSNLIDIMLLSLSLITDLTNFTFSVKSQMFRMNEWIK